MVQPPLDTNVIGLWVQLSFLVRAVLLLLLLAAPSTIVQSIKTNLCSRVYFAHALYVPACDARTRPVMQPVIWLHPS